VLLLSPLAQSEPTSLMLLVDRLARAPLSQVLIFALVWTILRFAIAAPLLKAARHERRGGWKALSFLNEFADAMVYAAIIVFMLVRPFGIQTFWIPSESMFDTLHKNDMIVANKFIYRISDPKREDIVVFRPPAEALQPGDSATDFIKRLVGVPGDVIEIRKGKLFLNGEEQSEPFVDFTDPFQPSTLLPKDRWDDIVMPDFKLVKDGDKYVPLTIMGDRVNGETVPSYTITDPDEMARLKALPPAAVPDGHYLFMGDNRNGSLDSRFWGVVPRASIIGRSEFIWMPLSRLGQTK
jgi:signal peptidase I